jgi:hypothetical protein
MAVNFVVGAATLAMGVPKWSRCPPYSFKACVNGATEARKLFGQADHRAHGSAADSRRASTRAPSPVQLGAAWRRLVGMDE